MDSRKNVIAVALIAVAMGLGFALWPSHKAPPANISAPVPAVAQPSQISPADSKPAQAAALPSTSPPAVAAISPMPLAATGGESAHQTNTAPASPAPATPPQDRNPMTDLDKVRHMITDYHTIMGENPVGTNAEIMKSLMGGNPRAATFGPPDGQMLNDKGELIDLWGTPYFFHQLSKDVMEVRSAGPDKVMWTADDAVIR